VPKIFGSLLVLIGSLNLSTVEAGFRSPESLVRNVYAYYGDRSSDLSNGLPRDPATQASSSIRVAGSMDFPTQSAFTIFWCRARCGSLAASRYRSCVSNSTRPMSPWLSTIWPRDHVEFYSGEPDPTAGDFRCRSRTIPCACSLRSTKTESVPFIGWLQARE